MADSKFSAGALVRQGTKVLLIRTKSAWEIPKGHSEGRESKEATAIREVCEETGLDISLEDLAFEYEGVDRRKIYIYWAKKEGGQEGKIVPSEGILGSGWFEINEAIALLKPKQSDGLKKVLKEEKTT